MELGPIRILVALFLVCMLVPATLAATASISQSGADGGTVMKGVSFSLMVTGISGDGQATIQLPSGFTTSEETTKTFTGGTVSWTTITANEKLTSQTISVLISVAGSPSTATTSSFNVVLAPSLSITATPSSKTVTAGEEFEVGLNVQNAGETTAQSVAASITLPSGYSLTGSSTQTIGSINGGTGGTGSSTAVAWTVTASNPGSSSTITLSVDASNADSESASVAMTKAASNQSSPGSAGGGSAGGAAPTKTTKGVFSNGKIAFTGSAGDALRFPLGNANHTITITRIYPASVNLTIKSVTIKDSIRLSETKSYDLDGNAAKDISIRIDSITGNKTSLTVTDLSSPPSSPPPAAVGESAVADSETAPAQGEIAPSENAGAPQAEEVGGKGARGIFGWLIFAVAALLVLIIVVSGLIMIKRKKKASAGQGRIKIS